MKLFTHFYQNIEQLEEKKFQLCVNDYKTNSLPFFYYSYFLSFSFAATVVVYLKKHYYNHNEWLLAAFKQISFNALAIKRSSLRINFYFLMFEIFFLKKNDITASGFNEGLLS